MNNWKCSNRLLNELFGLFKKYEFKRWTADVEARANRLQAKGAKTSREAAGNAACRADEQTQK